MPENTAPQSSPDFPPAQFNAESKAALRRFARQFRRKLDTVSLSGQIREKLLHWQAFRQAKAVLSYAPLPGEIDLLPLISTCPEKAWYLPRLTDDGAMRFHRYRSEDMLEQQQYGLMAPQQDTPTLAPDVIVSLVLIPGLMFDRRGNRLGFGKAYYDRFFQDYALPPSSLKVGITPDLLIIPVLPHDPWDIPMDVLLSEGRVHLTSSTLT